MNITIPSHFFIHNDSPTHAGGIAMYISTDTEHSILTDVKIETNGCKNISMKINVIIGTIYRHSKNDLKKFLVGFNTSLEKI